MRRRMASDCSPPQSQSPPAFPNRSPDSAPDRFHPPTHTTATPTSKNPPDPSCDNDLALRYQADLPGMCHRIPQTIASPTPTPPTPGPASSHRPVAPPHPHPPIHTHRSHRDPQPPNPSPYQSRFAAPQSPSN